MQPVKARAESFFGRKLRRPIEGLFCNYPHRNCLHNRLEGHEYCVRHILEDKNGPYKQCNFVSNQSGRRCHNAAPKSDKKDGYCLEHARRSLRARQQASRKSRPRENPENLLENLEQHTKKPEASTSRDGKKQRSTHEEATARLLEYASSSDSESESHLVDQAWRGDVNSDAESVDSEQEDTLKHAGVYTAEEVAQITRDKLIRLQSLYIEQFKRLQHVLKEKRRKYVHTVKHERSTLGSVHVAKEDPEQREQYEKLCALKRYHKRFGKEALLHRQSKERRIAVTEGPNYKPPSYPKCIHSDTEAGLMRCTQRTVPLSKYCLQHVMHDPHQVLYQGCRYGNGVCTRSLAVPTLTADLYCAYHLQLTRGRRRFPPEEEENIDEPPEVELDVIGHEEIAEDDSPDVSMETEGLEFMIQMEPVYEMAAESISVVEDVDILETPQEEVLLDTPLEHIEEVEN